MVVGGDGDDGKDGDDDVFFDKRFDTGSPHVDKCSILKPLD